MRRKGNSRALLVEIKIGTVTVEDRMKFPQKYFLKLPYAPAIPLLGMYL